MRNFENVATPAGDGIDVIDTVEIPEPSEEERQLEAIANTITVCRPDLAMRIWAQVSAIVDDGGTFNPDFDWPTANGDSDPNLEVLEIKLPVERNSQ